MHPELGFRLMQRMMELLKDSVTVDRHPGLDGKRMIMILSPISGQKAKVKEEIKEA